MAVVFIKPTQETEAQDRLRRYDALIAEVPLILTLKRGVPLEKGNAQNQLNFIEAGSEPELFLTGNCVSSWREPGVSA